MIERPTSLTTQRLLLRIALPGMVDEILDFRIRNRAFLKPWLPLQIEQAFHRDFYLDFLKSEEKEWKAGRTFRFLVSLQEDPDRIIGDIRFSSVIRGAFQNTFLGYVQDEHACGHGYMQEALTKGIWYMFALEELHRVQANIMPSNMPSLKLVERIGFQEVGYSPRYLNINGEWEDHKHFALLNE